MTRPLDAPPPISPARLRELIARFDGNLSEVARFCGYTRPRLDRLLTHSMRDAASRARARSGVPGPRREA